MQQLRKRYGQEPTSKSTCGATKPNNNDNNRNNTTRSLRRLCGRLVGLHNRFPSRKLCEIQRIQGTLAYGNNG